MSASCSGPGGGEDDSCGTSRENASTRSGSTSVTSLTTTPDGARVWQDPAPAAAPVPGSGHRVRV